MINKFEEDSSRHHNNYIRELAKSNDLYRQLGEASKEYEERVRRYNEDKIGDEQAIVFLFENLTLLRKLEFEHKHLIEQLVSTFNDKDRNIEELKRELNDENMLKNKLHKKLQD